MATYAQNNFKTKDIKEDERKKQPANNKNAQPNNNPYVDSAKKNPTTGLLMDVANSVTNPSSAAAGNGFSYAPFQGGNATAPSFEAPAVKDFSYDPFRVSGGTAAADQHRQEVAAQKPGEFTYGAYGKSDAVLQAEALLQQHLAQKPGAYQSQWQPQMDSILSQIQNRKPFSYNVNEDALYQQYADQYMLQGLQGSMDVMGQAAAMTGGYGNSYAQTVGQQTYQGYLQQLNDRVPELYQMAQNQYNREGDELYQQYAMYADRENLDYGRYRDNVSDYNTELGRLTEDARYQTDTDYGRYLDQYNMAYGQHRDEMADWQQEQARADSEYWNQYGRDREQYVDDRNFAYGQHVDERDFAYNQYADERDFAYNQYVDDRNFNYGQYVDDRNFAYGQYVDDRNFAYQQDRDQVADQQWQAAFDNDNYWAEKDFNYRQDRDKVADEQWQATFDEGQRQFNIANDVDTGSGSGGSSGGGSYDPNAAAKQRELIAAGYNIAEDGIWGSQSQTAWEDYQKKNNPTYRDPVETPGTGGGSDPETWDFETIDVKLNEFLDEGASDDEVREFLAQAMQAGYITKDQYTSLKNTYVPRNYNP